MNKGMNELKDK